jgi:DNA replication and repair protein RecF
MSELDAERRARLVEHLAGGGQSVVTTTDLGHVPGAQSDGVLRLAVQDGAVADDRPGAEVTA